MFEVFLKVLFVLVALTMIVMILMQQGVGAQAGSGFGGGSSSSVFGSRGSSNFLSKSTRNLAVVFFALSLFMAWTASNDNSKPRGGGVISAEQQKAAVKVPASEVPQAPSLTPKAGATIPSDALPATPVVIPPVTPSATPADKDAAKPANQGSKGA